MKTKKNVVNFDHKILYSCLLVITLSVITVLLLQKSSYPRENSMFLMEQAGESEDQCLIQIDSFQTSNWCGNKKYQSVSYTCYGVTQTLDDTDSCKAIDNWYSDVRKLCKDTGNITCANDESNSNEDRVKASPKAKPSVSPKTKPSLSPKAKSTNRPIPISTPKMSIIPLPTCQPRPVCLDAEPPCLLAEPVNGWCAD